MSDTYNTNDATIYGTDDTNRINTTTYHKEKNVTLVSLDKKCVIDLEINDENETAEIKFSSLELDFRMNADKDGVENFIKLIKSVRGFLTSRGVKVVCQWVDINEWKNHISGITDKFEEVQTFGSIVLIKVNIDSMVDAMLKCFGLD
jgi:uncharacterized protein YqgV (UPF0045/DUF77 family)